MIRTPFEAVLWGVFVGTAVLAMVLMAIVVLGGKR